MKASIPFTLAVLAVAAPALAQQSGQSTPELEQNTSGTQSSSTAQTMNPADPEFMAAMQKMNRAMMQANDADPGEAWMKKMIEHHRGAVEMSQIVLKHTNDRDVEKEAHKTIDENEKGIRDLQTKLRKKR